MTHKIEKSIHQFMLSRHDRALDFSQYSHARLGSGHTGGHLPLSAWLNLQKDFAEAKDAVFSSFDVKQVASLCDELGLTGIEVQSQANDVMQFLLRPDLGRILSAESEIQLENPRADDAQRDLLIVISGGLSPIAIQKHIPSFLKSFVNKAHQRQWTLAPIIINPRGRVALGDHINRYFKAAITLMLIGERPGLSTPDSMGIYLTYQAKPGCTDEQRNCISNIHEHGLLPDQAAEKLVSLIVKSLASRMSGLALKAGYPEIPEPGNPR